jgi:hypothetical protein
VRDGDDGAALHELIERRADQLLGVDVKARGGLVEQQDPCIFEKGPGDGDALALPARQLDAAIADDRGESVGQRIDEIAACGRRRRADLGLRGFGASIANIVQDGAVQQANVLRHDGDRIAQALLRDAGDILAADQDAAGLHVIEALQQRK